MKLTYSVLGSLREKDVAEMRVRYGEFGDSPETEIPPDGYGEVIGGLQELTLGWESTDRESEPVEIVITRKDGKAGRRFPAGGQRPPERHGAQARGQEHRLRLQGGRIRAARLCARPARPGGTRARPDGDPRRIPAPQVSTPAAPSAQEAASRAADLPPLIEGNPPCLRIPYDEVMEVNLIDRESRTCCPVTGERCGAVLARLNSLTPQEDLSVTPDEAGLRLLQVRLLDGTKYDFWCHSNLLMEGETPLADASRLRDLYDSFYEIEKETYGQNRATAEWLGYMNPYRITGDGGRRPLGRHARAVPRADLGAAAGGDHGGRRAAQGGDGQALLHRDARARSGPRLHPALPDRAELRGRRRGIHGHRLPRRVDRNPRQQHPGIPSRL